MLVGFPLKSGTTPSKLDLSRDHNPISLFVIKSHVFCWRKSLENFQHFGWKFCESVLLVLWHYYSNCFHVPYILFLFVVTMVWGIRVRNVSTSCVFEQSPNVLPLQNSSRPVSVRYIPALRDLHKLVKGDVKETSLCDARANKKADKKRIKHLSIVFSWFETAGLHQLGAVFRNQFCQRIFT